MIKINREFLKTFVESLNVINMNAPVIFPRESNGKNPGGFELNIQDVVLGGDTGMKSIKIWFYYKERNRQIDIYRRDYRIRMDKWEQEAEDSFFQHCYYEIMNHLLFCIDSVGNLSGVDGRRIDVLSIQTIMKEGLKQIDNGEENKA